MFSKFAIFIGICSLGLGSICAEDLTFPQNSPELTWIFGGWSISGNTGISPSRLNALPKIQARAFWAFWRDQPLLEQAPVEDGLSAMERLLEVEGYYSNQYQLTWDLDDNKAIAQVEIESGPRMMCENVVVEPSPEASNDQFDLIHQLESQLTLKVGGFFSEAEFQNSQQAILSALLDQGHLWAKVTPSAQLSKTSNLAHVRYLVDPGPKTTTGETKIKGLESIRERLVTREFSHQKGEIFHFSNLVNTRQRLIGTRWFSSVILTPDPNVPKGAPEVPILLELDEAEPRTIGIGLGIGSEMGPRSRISWQHRNWLGLGWKNKVELQISRQELRFRTTVDVPYALRNDASARYTFSYGQDDEDDYKVKVGEFEGLWTRQVDEQLSFSCGWGLKSEEHDSDASLLLSLGDPPETALMTGPILQIGEEWTSKKWGGHGLSAAWQGQAYFDTNNSHAAFWQQEVTLRFRQNCPFGWKVQQRFKLGWKNEWLDGGIPVSDRYYVGGSGSVRGYSRKNISPRNTQGDKLGGKSMSEFTLEFQHALWKKELIGAIFADGGQVDLSTTGWQMNDYHYSLGTGIGYTLAMGIMRLDLGIPLKRQSWDAPFQIHFDFGVSL